MKQQETHAVTGAYGYSGKYITHRLLAKGHKVITLTNSLNRVNPFGERVPAFPFNWQQPQKLVESLRGVKVLYNTYWVRFNHKTFTHADAVRNTQILFDSAKEAGVERIVHVSIANPSLDSELEYYSGKAEIEEMLKASGISYAILRPTVLFGKEDVLINNIAWVLRRLPVIGVFGDGEYKLQPIYVDDLAQLAVEYGEKRADEIINAIGPETFSHRKLYQTIGEIIGKKRMIISVPKAIGYAVGWLIGKLQNDTFLTKEEIAGLTANLLYVETPPTGSTKLTAWARKNAGTLGKQYTSELARRENRATAYESN